MKKQGSKFKHPLHHKNGTRKTKLPLGMEYLCPLLPAFFKGSLTPKISENLKIATPSSTHKIGSGVKLLASAVS